MRIPDDPDFPPMMAYVEDSDEDEEEDEEVNNWFK